MASAPTAGITSLQALQGNWKPIYQEIDGQMIPPSEYATTLVELRGNDFRVLKNGTAAYEGRFTVDAQVSPMGIVLIYTKSAHAIFLGGPRPGVLQLEGETLKWCFGAVGQPAPQGLNTFPGSESVLSIYQKDPAGTSRRAAAVISRFGGALPW